MFLKQKEFRYSTIWPPLIDHLACGLHNVFKRSQLAHIKLVGDKNYHHTNTHHKMNSTQITRFIFTILLLLITNQVPNAQTLQATTSSGSMQPTFIKNMDSLTVRENTPIGEIVYTLEAQLDQPTAEVVKILYGIEGTQLFNVDKNTGQVKVAHLIDREQITSDSVTFQVSATALYNQPVASGNGQQQTKLQQGSPTQLTITVYILDENDNPPKIERVRVGRLEFDSQALAKASLFANSLSAGQRISPVVRINVSESAPIGSVLVDLIEAIDVDKASSNPLRSICVECEPEFELRSDNSLNDKLNSSIVLINPLIHIPRNNIKQLQVIISDGKFNSTLLIELTIEDVQNKPPQFIGSTTCIVQENVPIDRTIMTLQAVDGDAMNLDDVNAPKGGTQIGRQILYEMVNNNDPMLTSGSQQYDEFKLHPLTGQLQVANRIDREMYLSSNGILSLKIRAKELTVNANTIVRQDEMYDSIIEKLQPYVDSAPDSQSEIEITVIIVDVNDNEPHWLNASEILALNMNQSPNWYSSLPNDLDTGRIYQLYVQENSVAGSPITTKNEMFVYDLDNGENANFNLTLVDPFNLFDVEPKQVSGFALVTLKLAQNNLNSRRLIDYENVNERSFIIQLIARETNTNEKLSSKAQVQINVVDVNDNAPEFKEPIYTANVREDAQAGKTVLLVQATDKDEISKHLSYSLHGRSAYLFDINRLTGLITVAKCESIVSNHNNQRRQISTSSTAAAVASRPCLDYETQKTHHLMVEVSDGELTSKVPLTVFVDDASDNPPVFSLPIVDAVIEEGSDRLDPPIKIEATDVDQSSVLTYSIVEGNFENLFSINNATGELQLTRQIKIAHDDILSPSSTGAESSSGVGDYRYQQLNKITLIVQATDGVFTANGTVRIDVLDANDNAPKFLRNFYSVEIHESIAPGQNILTVRAIDLDRGNNARVSYRLQRGSYGQFDIDENSGVISVSRQLQQDFDSSKRANYTLEVVAYDHGIVPKSSSVMVHVHILDTNRKAPEFNPQIQRTTVPESTLNNTIIHRMSVSDQDQSPESMLVFTPGPIEALDRNGQQVASSEIDRLESMFSVSTNTGDVMVNSALDYDFASYVNLTIFVSSHGPSPAMLHNINGSDSLPLQEEFSARSVGYLIINIIDDNTNPPMFAAPWSIQQPELTYQMLEELPIGSILTQLVASDIDSKISHFKIDPPNEYFELSSAQSGVIVNRKLIDYDSLMRQTFMKPHRLSSASTAASVMNTNLPIGTNTGNNIIQFNVHVFDSGQPQLSAKATVSVEILPVNDWDCKFEQSTYEVRVKENTPPETSVLQVKAVDLDYGDQHNTVRYQLIGEHSDLFDIDQRTGLITVSIKGSLSLDRERLSQSSFALTVVGRDEPLATPFSQLHFGVPKNAKDKQPQQQPGRSCSATIRVHVDDVNDNPPIFAQKLYEVTAYDTDAVDVPLAKLIVRDDDSQNAPNTTQSSKTGLPTNFFKILAGNVNDIFNITNAGLLFATKPLNELITPDGPPLQLRIQVKQQSPSLTSGLLSSFTDECLVRIHLVKINRYGPEWRFEQPKSSIAIEENSKPGSLVTQLKCIDRDFETKGPNRLLELEAGSSSGKLFGSLENLNLRYWIKEKGLNVQETSEFKLDPISGNLTTKIELDREKHHFYQLIVACEDNGRPQSLESVTPIFVTVLDVDDNKPEFLVPKTTTQDLSRMKQIQRFKSSLVGLNQQQQQQFKAIVNFVVEEHQSKGIPVGELNAIDRDLESQIPINYCLIEGNDFQEFSLDRITGILYTNQTLDREKQSSYDLVVRAINDGSSCEDHMMMISSDLKVNSPLNSTSSLISTSYGGSRSRRSVYNSERNTLSTPEDLSRVLVKVDVLDINDNKPSFKKPLYRAGVHHRSLMNTLITQVAAFDPDAGLNGTIGYSITEVLMYKTTPIQQQQQSSRKYEVISEHQPIGKPIKLIQYPFRIDQQGNLYTQQLLTQYQLMSMFVLQIEATEKANPKHTAITKLEIYVYETSSQLKIRINLHPRLVETYRYEIENLLSNATKYTAIINRARSYHAQQQVDNLASKPLKSPQIDHRIDTNQQQSNGITHQTTINSNNENEPNFSNIHLIFVDNFRIVNPNLVMEKFDLTSAQLFMPQTLIQQGANNQYQDSTDGSSKRPNSDGQQQQQMRQLQLNEVSSLIDKIALASVQSAEYHSNPSALAGIDWLESPSAIYVTLTILLIVMGFVIFLFGCCCTSKIKDHIIKVAMDKLVKQQTLQAKINEQMLAATNQSALGGANRANQVAAAQGQEYILQQGGFMSSFDATKGCIANNNENISILQRAMESGEFIDPNYTTLNGHVNMGAHFYDASELEQQAAAEAEANGHHSMKHHHELGGGTSKQLNGSLEDIVVQNVEDDDDNDVGGGGDLKLVQKSSKIPTTNGNGNGMIMGSNLHNNARQRQQVPHNN